MRITSTEVVVRFHIIFSVEQTIELRRMGLIPPEGEPEAEMWVTAGELDAMSSLEDFPVKPGDVLRAIKQVLK